MTRPLAVIPSTPSMLADMAASASLEVMPRTLAKLGDLTGLMPQGASVFIAHIDGETDDAMVAAAVRLARAGLRPIPHIPARSVPDAASVAVRIARYAGEAGVTSVLALAGGRSQPAGPFPDTLSLLRTGTLEDAGITEVFFAGHPEGNRDIDPGGGEARAMAALHDKMAWLNRTGLRGALVTQFTFEAAPVIAWTERLAAEGLHLPVHLGLAGPARLQTLIKYAVACGIGPSLGVLQKRARDLSRLVQPHSPDAVAREIAAHLARAPGTPIAGLHLFPLGGIAAAASWRTETAALGAAGPTKGSP